MMTKSNEYGVFYQGDHLPVHYDPNSLQFTEISDLHEEVLADFRRPVENLADRLALYGEAKKEAFEELCEAGLIGDVCDRVDERKCVDFRPSIVAFRVVLTEHCNLCCAECFVTKNADRLHTMTERMLDMVVGKIVEYSKKRQIGVQFFGGEPTIRFDYIRRAVERLEYEASGSVDFSITTNATLITPEMADFFQKHCFRVAVSLDGGRELHDMLRPRSDGEGSYDAAKRGVDLMRESGLSPSVIVTPHPQYLEKLESDFAMLVDDFCPPSVAINTPFDYETLAWSVDGRKFARFLMKTAGICNKRGVEVHSALSPILAALSNHVPRNSPCSMLCDDVMVSVRTDGKMSFCAQKWHDDMVTDIIPSEDDLVVTLKRDDECDGCVARTICGGPCPAYQMISGERRDRNKCEFMHAILDEIVVHLDWFEEKD